MRRGRAVSVLIAVLSLAMPALADKANSAYKAGVNAEVHNQTDAAYEAYRRAYAIKPNDAKYLAAYTRMRFHAAAEHVHKGEVLLDAGKLPLALAEFLRAAEIDSSNDLAQQEVRRTREMIDKAALKAQPEAPEEPLAEMADRAKGPTKLQPLPNTPVTLHMTETSKAIYKTIGNLAGINIIFDPEYTPRKISVELNQVALRDALEIVALASKTFWRPLTANTIYVAAESAGKRREVEQSVLKTFYLSNTAAASELTEAATAIRSILDVSRVQAIPSQNALLVRATPDQLVLAEKLLEDLDKAPGEVMIDVAILEVTRDRLRTLGMNPPTSISGALQPSSLTLHDLANLSSGSFLVSIPGISFTALMSDTNTKIIQNPQIRVLDNQKATLKIGDRVPVATGSFAATASNISPLVNTQFQYLDVGVNVDITPRIHSRHEVTLKIGMEISSVAGEQNIGGVTQPIIGQRRIEHETRLREGEVNLLGGILEDTQSDSISGYPWLTKIPLMRYLFGQNQKDHTQREIVFAITPHIVRAQDVSARNLRSIDVGTPSSIELHFNEVPKAPASATPAAPPTPTAPQQQTPAPTPPQPTARQQQAPPQSAAPAGIPATTEQRRATAQAGNATSGPTQNAAGAASTPAPAPTANTTVSFEPASMSERVGSTFKLNVSVSGAQDVFSIPLEISYDPEHLKVVDVSNGGFLSQDRQTVALVYRADKTKGILQITGTRPPKSGGVSGSGTAFVITLSAQSAGETVMDITGASVVDPNMRAAPAVGGDVLIKIIGNEAPTEEKSNPSVKPDQEKTRTDNKRTADAGDVARVAPSAPKDNQAMRSPASLAGTATAPAESAAQPVAPAAPPIPETMPPAQPKVTLTGGLLKIDAFNSTLADILAKVAALTGADMDVPPSAGRERIAAELGPGPPRQILKALLSGTGFEYVISASNDDPQAIRGVLLMPRGTKSDMEKAAQTSRSPRPVEVAATPEPESPPNNPAPVQPESTPILAQAESAAVQTSSESPLPVPEIATPEREQASDIPPTRAPLPAALTQQSMAQQLQQMYQQRRQQIQEQRAAQRNP